MSNNTPITGVAAGVPFVATSPATPRPDAPVVAMWHLMEPPASEAAFAAALPLTGLDAWRISFGLPLTGSRLPEGGFDEIMRRGYEDAVLNLQGPISGQAAAEFPAAYAELAERFGFGDGALAVVGGSMGAAVAALALTEGDLPVSAAVLISPLLDLRRAVAAGEKQYGITYEWSERSDRVAERLDVVARAAEITARHGDVAVLAIVGSEDDAAFVEPATALQAALAEGPAGPERSALVTIEGMAHAFADAPGMDPAPQTPLAVEVDRHASAWLARFLPGA